MLEDAHVSERECRQGTEDDRAVAMKTRAVAMKTRNRLYQFRKATAQAVNELSAASLDTRREKICENEMPLLEIREGNERRKAEE